MKKIVSLLLALACLASLIVLPVSAADLDKETVQKAVLETAFAYYRKADKIQYDSAALTYENAIKSGIKRLCTGSSPEEAAHDDTLFTVCSDWCFDVYWNAFGYSITENGRKCLTQLMTARPTSDPTVVLKFGQWMEDVHTRDRQEFITKLQQVWEPGDVLAIYSRAEDGTEKGGHTMMYIGDYDGNGKTEIMHSSGEKIDMSTGVDKVEHTRLEENMGRGVGSVRIDDTFEHLLDPSSTSRHNMTKDTYSEMILLRPRLDPNFPKEMTPSAQSRLKYPGLDIDRSSDLHKYNSTQTGNEITVTITLQNDSDVALTSIPVTEVAPQGATIVEGSVTGGGTASASGVKWTANVPAKGKTEMSYKVKVTAARGAVVTLPAGTVDQIPTRELTYAVSGKPLATETMTALGSGTKDFGLSKISCNETDFANVFYESVLNIDLGLPTKMQDVLDALFTIVDVPNATAALGYKMLAQKPADQLNETGKYLSSMLLPEHLAGRAVWKESDVFTSKAVDRATEYKQDAYKPGDIFLCLKNKSYTQVTNPSDVVVYINLGNGMVASFEDGRYKITTFDNTIAVLLRMNVSIALRPALALDNINANAVQFKFTDVKENAWYYTYVKSLVTKKVINGMTPTTFAPNGNLTYGQALKLITLAVGEKEQAAANGHWAGGYLALAKSKGWLAGDVNLNANITRLQFCQIAAKAAGVTAQPAKNPFVDTTDASVLALYNAGVINGMTASSFQPGGLLTRAQIAKIIWCLQAL